MTAALQRFARQSRTQVIYSAADLRGRRTQGVSGRLSPAEALRRLVDGSGAVLVQDPSGATVNNLSQSAFTIYENGTQQEIVNFLPVSTPNNILLLFDRSGSTQDKWLIMQRAVAGFIANLRSQDRIEIATFDYTVDVQLEWTNDRQKSLLVLPELIKATNIGGTEFYRSVEQTLRREFRKPTGRRGLVVLTDGRDTSLYNDVVKRNRLLEPKDDRPYQNVLRFARTQRIPIYFVAFNTDKNFEPNLIGADEYRNLRQIFPNSTIPDRYLSGVRSLRRVCSSLGSLRSDSAV